MVLPESDIDGLLWARPVWKRKIREATERDKERMSLRAKSGQVNAHGVVSDQESPGITGHATP